MGNGHFWIRHAKGKILVDFVWRRGMCVRWRGDEYYGDFPPPTDPRLRARPDMKKKSKNEPGVDVMHRAAIDAGTLKDWLPLIEHCAVCRYEDGDPRKPGWFTVKVQGSAWVCQVKDPDSRMSFSAVGHTFMEAVSSACLLLGCDEAPWEPDQFLEDMQGKGKKK